MDRSHGWVERAEAFIVALVATQFGVFTREQALAAGFTPRMIGRRLASGRWIRMDHSVYRVATTPLSWDLRVMAACLGGPAVVSHRAAARLWRLPGFEAASPEVTAYRHLRRTANTIIWHESRFLDEGRDTTMIDGIPLTSATRTIADLSLVATVDELEIALDNACHRGLTSTTKVGTELARLQRLSGTGCIRAVLGRKIDDAVGSFSKSPESPLESRTAIVLRSSGLPIPVGQFEVHDGEAFVARVDFAWPQHKVALEVDGFSFHSDRAVWERDRDRQSLLAALGWCVLHVTHRGLANPDRFISEVRKALGVSGAP